MRITRRQFYPSLAAVLAYPLVEPWWLEVTHRRLPLQGLRSPIRVLHMSDLHASVPVPFSMIEHAITAGLAEKPDVICVTGDFVTTGADYIGKEYSNVLKRLSAFAPTYAVVGNHDGGAWSEGADGRGDHNDIDRMLEESNIDLLHNRSKTIAVRDSSLTLAGTGDLWSQELDAQKAFSETAADPIVLLSHNPDSKDLVARYPWQLMLSGHTHGGQVIWPFDGPRYAPVQDKRYVDGLRPWGTRHIQVSRGVGNLLGVRFRCRPEVTILDLVTV